MSETELSAGVVVSMWASMVSWNTPTVLFCVLNLMICTIFILKSLNTYTDRDRDRDRDRDHQNQQHNDEDNLPQLFRLAPSLLLQRVKSFNFSLYRSQNNETQIQFITDDHPPSNQTQNHDYRSQSNETQIQLITDDDPPSNQTQNHDLDRSKSEASAITPAVAKIPVKKQMRKSASEKSVFMRFDEEEEEEEEVELRRPATVREGKGIETAAEFGEDEGVDEKADDFIIMFRQQLKLQRIDSFLRYKDMLKEKF